MDLVGSIGGGGWQVSREYRYSGYDISYRIARVEICIRGGGVFTIGSEVTGVLYSSTAL